MRALHLLGGIALLSAVGSASAGEWVVGASYGVANGDSSAGELNSQLAAMGLDATASSPDDSRGAWQAYLGYNYMPQFGVEIGYVDLGEVSTVFSGTATDIDTFIASAGDIHPLTAQGWKLSGTYRHPLGKGVIGAASIGAFAWKSDYTLSTTTVSRDFYSSGIDPVIGLGVEYEVYLDTYLHADYEFFDIDGEDISMFSVGVSYRLE